jgi:RNA polymerase sigma factor (sigma-70 family)
VASDRTPEFVSFYDETRPGLVRAVALATGNADLATEAVDEAMTRAFASWNRLRRHVNPSGWVYRVAVNWAISFMRREARRPASAPPADAEMPDVIDDAVRRALASLDVKHRSVVVCRHLLGWSERETAEALNIRPGTVKSRLSRASADHAHALMATRVTSCVTRWVQQSAMRYGLHPGRLTGLVSPAERLD